MLIPKAAVKRLMKIDKDVNQVANDAVILVAKATELFLEKLMREAYAVADEDGREQIKYEDLSDAREKDPDLEFLSHIMPPPMMLERVPARDDDQTPSEGDNNYNNENNGDNNNTDNDTDANMTMMPPPLPQQPPPSFR